MTFKIEQLKTGTNTKILIIYTGGTLGMVVREDTLIPFKFSEILKNVPEISRLSPEIHFYSFETPLDSSDANLDTYLKLARIIHENYNTYDGFVVLHGTDTMAFSASVLSFLIQNPKKPIVFTGAQLPIGIPRTDARENLITSIEIASGKINNECIVPEVCIYFNGRLLRGNRAKKRQSSQFDAFDSENYPYLAEIGVSIDYNFRQIRYSPSDTKFYDELNDKITVLTLFPGISKDIINKHTLNPHTDAVIMLTYGSGNAPSGDWFLDSMKAGLDSGKTILNISQCTGGRVVMGKYASSQKLKEMGVLSGNDMTYEAAIGKMMWALAQKERSLKEIFEQNIAGEVSLP